jgi:hypothetical protein
MTSLGPSLKEAANGQKPVFAWGKDCLPKQLFINNEVCTALGRTSDADMLTLAIE